MLDKLKAAVDEIVYRHEAPKAQGQNVTSTQLSERLRAMRFAAKHILEDRQQFKEFDIYLFNVESRDAE